MTVSKSFRAGALAAMAAVSACTHLDYIPVTGSQDQGAPLDQASGMDQPSDKADGALVGSCLWPLNQGQRITWQTQSGSLYEISIYGYRGNVGHFKALLVNKGNVSPSHPDLPTKGNSVYVEGRLNIDYPANLQSDFSEAGGVVIDRVIAPPDVSPPSADELLTNYNFSDAFVRTRRAFWQEPTRLPGVFCDSVSRIHQPYRYLAPRIHYSYQP